MWMTWKGRVGGVGGLEGRLADLDCWVGLISKKGGEAICLLRAVRDRSCEVQCPVSTPRN